MDIGNDTKEYPSAWFDAHCSAMYATISDLANPLYCDDVDLQDFHWFCHLSWYEIQCCLDHDLDLQTNWNGHYDVWTEEDVDHDHNDADIMGSMENNNNNNAILGKNGTWFQCGS